MITSFFSVVINWCLLYMLLTIGLSFRGKPLYGWPPDHAGALLATMGMGSLLLLALTPLGESLLRQLYKCRRCTAEESAHLQPLFDEVCRRANHSPENYRLYLTGDDSPNAFALGAKTITVTSGLLRTATDNEIKGVLAHELGHIALGHTLWLRITCTTEQVGRCVLGFYYVVSVVCAALSRLPLVGFFLLPLSLLISAFMILFRFIVAAPFQLGMFFGSRRSEYAADRFAANIGYGRSLHSYLSRLVLPNEKESGFFARLHDTHPVTVKRVQRLEQLAA